MNKLAVSTIGAALGGIVLGMGMTLAFYPRSSPTEPSHIASRQQLSASVSATDGMSEPAGQSGSPKAKVPAVVPDKPTATVEGAATVLRDVVATLRKAGVPDLMVASFIKVQVEDQHEERQRDVFAKIARGEADPALRRTMSRDSTAESDQMIRELLGEEALRQRDKRAHASMLLYNGVLLSPAHLDAWYDVEKQFADRRAELFQRREDGEIDPITFGEQNRALTLELEAKRKEALGTDGFIQYETCRLPYNSNTVRWYLRDMKLDETQFHALAKADATYVLQKAPLDEAMRTGSPAGENLKQQLALGDARETDYQRILGDAAWAEFQKRNDRNYQQMVTHATPWQLTQADIDYVYDTQHQYQQAEREAVRNNTGGLVNWQELSKLRQQAVQQLQARLGADRYTRMKKSGIITIDLVPAQ